jgi:Tfp pilus assembly protein PilO
MPKSQLERMWLLAGGVAAVILVLLGWFLFIGPQRSHTSSVNSQISVAEQRNATLQARIRALQGQNANLAQYQAQLAQAKLALPDTSGLPDFLRTLQAIGSATQTTVTALTVGAPTNLTAVTTGSGGAAAASPAPGSAGKTNTSSVGTVYALPITIAISGSFTQLDGFLSQLQSVQPRAVLITQLTQGSATSGTGGLAAATTLSLTMQAFVAPSSAAESAQLAAAAKTGK